MEEISLRDYCLCYFIVRKQRAYRSCHVVSFCTGRRGKPKERVLFRSRDDEDLLAIYWVDQADLGEGKKRDANGVPHGARCIQLRAVMEIRRGTAIDPSHSEFCGTPILRKNCEPADYAYCVSLICHDRWIKLVYYIYIYT